MDKRKRKVAWLDGLVVTATVICLAAAGCGKGEKPEAPEGSVQASPAAKTDISRIVNTEAVIFPVAQSAINPKISAPAKKFYVTREHKARQDHLLAVLGKRDI